MNSVEYQSVLNKGLLGTYSYDEIFDRLPHPSILTPKNSDQNHVKTSKSLVSHELDDKVFEIFQRLRNKNYPLNGLMLKRISLRISKKLKYSYFKASNGWLDKFKIRHKLNFKILSGEVKSAKFSAIDGFRTVLTKKM